MTQRFGPWLVRCLAFTLLMYGPVAGAKSLHFDCHDEFSDVNQLVFQLYAELGIAIECVMLPRARGAVMVHGGELDGSLLRGAGFGERFPQLIRVEPPVLAMSLVVYRRRGSDVTLDNWRQHPIASLRGVIILDQLLAGLDVTRVNSLEAGIKSLSAGRVDVMVGDLRAVPSVIKALGVDNIERLSPPVHTELLYHYLQPEHEALARRLSAVLLKRPLAQSY